MKNNLGSLEREGGWHWESPSPDATLERKLRAREHNIQLAHDQVRSAESQVQRYNNDRRARMFLARATRNLEEILADRTVIVPDSHYAARIP